MPNQGTITGNATPDNRKAAERLRTAADGLQRQIDAKRSTFANSNPTPRRAGFQEAGRKEAARLEELQGTLRNMADAHEAGTIHYLLSRVRDLPTLRAVRRDTWPEPVILIRVLKECLKAIDETPSFDPQVVARSVAWASGRLSGLDLDAVWTIPVPEPADWNHVDILAKATVDAAGYTGIARKEYERSAIINSGKTLKECYEDADRLRRAGITQASYGEAHEAITGYIPGADPEQLRRDALAAAERELIGLRIPGWFPTPRTLAERMVGMAALLPDSTVLEPSAGNGVIADAARDYGVAKVMCVEYSDRLAGILELKGHHVACADFLRYTPPQRYDAVIMNPPFEGAADLKHVMRAWRYVRPGGTLVAITGPAWKSRTEERYQMFRDWIAYNDAYVEELPSGTFNDPGSLRTTGVGAILICVRKPVTPGVGDWPEALVERMPATRAEAQERDGLSLSGGGSGHIYACRRR